MPVEYVLGLGVAALVVVALYLWWAERHVDRALRQMAAELRASAGGLRQSPVTAEEWADLPPPVRRYLARAIPAGHTRALQVRIEHGGTFRTREQPEQWLPFQAVEHVTTSPPGFVWDATMRLGPLPAVRAVDAYRNGAGLLEARLLGAFKIAKDAGPEVDCGELARYLAETVWFPSALLPGNGLQWQAIDDHSAAAVFRDHGHELSMVFHFNDQDEVTRVETLRYRRENGRYRKLPWIAYCWNYAVRDGFRIPLEIRVVWHLPEGDVEYVREQVTRIEYEAEQGRVAA